MNCFVKYDSDFNQLICDNIDLIPPICQRCISEFNPKCLKHYSSLADNKFTYCYNGFASIKFGKNIYTCFTPMGCNGLKIMKKNNIDTSKFIIISENNYLLLLNEFSNLENQNEYLDASIHDLKNISTYFNSMKFKITNELPIEFLENENVISMLELYNLVIYRLSLIGKVAEQGYQKKYISIHSILLKLIRILSFKAKNKEVCFNIDNIEEIIVGNDNLYLAFFTILDNAVKYAPQKSEINIYFKNNVDNVVVSIDNRGPRLDENELSYITTRGYRGKFNNTTGSGVGLSIFKEICEKSDFKFIFKTKYLNPEQSLFTVSIALKKK